MDFCVWWRRIHFNFLHVHIICPARFLKRTFLSLIYFWHIYQLTVDVLPDFWGHRSFLCGYISGFMSIWCCGFFGFSMSPDIRYCFALFVHNSIGWFRVLTPLIHISQLLLSSAVRNIIAALLGKPVVLSGKYGQY